MLPFHPVSAATETQTLDTTLTHFAGGNFQLTALSPEGDGAVELARTGELRPWINATFSLPQGAELANEGAVAIGNRMYVIGGNGTPGATSNTVYWTNIDPADGTATNPLDGEGSWARTDETDLPEVQAKDSSIEEDPCINPVAALTEPAVVGVESDARGGDYIYVLGGLVRPPGCGENISSYAVHIGAIDPTDGTVAWRAGPTIPSGDSASQSGLHAASAVRVTQGGKTFIYLIGGERNYRSSIPPFKRESVGSAKVYYAEVMSNGNLSEWETAADIPLSPGEQGLWDAVAVAASSEDTGSAIYVTGGQTVRGATAAEDEYNTTVYRALVQSDGSLEWSDTVGEGGKLVSLPAPRINMSGVAYNNKLYFIGGLQIGQSDGERSVLTLSVRNDLTIENLNRNQLNPEEPADPPQFFVSSGNVLPAWRYSHANAIVPAAPRDDRPASAFIYVIAGEGEGGGDESVPTNTVFRGQLGGIFETNDSDVAATGWYYSKLHSPRLPDAEVRRFNWTTIKSDTVMDIKLEYRVTTNFCTSTDPFAGVLWDELDGTPDDPETFSASGPNTVEFEEDERPKANCIQYRAKLDKGQSSPILLDVGVEVESFSGYPDLRVLEIQDKRGEDGRTLTGLHIKIINKNEDGGETAAVSTVNTGSFFVDLCIYLPSDTVPDPALALPVNEPLPQCLKAYASVSSRWMDADKEYTISNRWHYPDNRPLTMDEMTAFFPEVGTYTIVVGVDSTDYVNEGDYEDNNTAALPIRVYGTNEPPDTPPDEPPPADPGEPEVEIEPVSDPTIYLPLIAR
jgi:hypothetical protein